MLVDFLSTKYRNSIDEGWGAFSIGNVKKAEEHFRDVLSHEQDPQMTIYDIVEAHNGIGAVNMAHKDFFEAARWYQESCYLLNEHFHNGWPKRLSWASYHDRGAMRVLVSLGQLAQKHGEFKKAKRYFCQLLSADSKDELGVKKYIDEIDKGITTSHS
jgi:tetratricopeptide (TPR) repeat protein